MTIDPKYVVRVNGRGNAWPIPLGETHPFYKNSKYEDLANASFSIVKYNGNNYVPENIEWEILIDAGHGAVQYLLKNSNRIPEALFLTHPHIDHTLGIDWVVQSHYRKHKTKYPIYATISCWETVKISFPHLIEMVDFYEIIYGESISLFNELKVSSFPVFHGRYAFGACMFLFQLNKKKILVTGDILVPMLLKENIELVDDVDLLITDANNRFPYPKSNHWSICKLMNINIDESFFDAWYNKISSSEIIAPHIHISSSQKVIDYINRWLIEFVKEDLVTNVFDFIKNIKAKDVWLVHYSGKEDRTYYSQEILNDTELTNWTNKSASSMLKNTFFSAVKCGTIYQI